MWGVLGEGMGAPLINKDQIRLLTKEELVGKWKLFMCKLLTWERNLVVVRQIQAHQQHRYKPVVQAIGGMKLEIPRRSVLTSSMFFLLSSGPDESVRAPDVVYRDATTGLILPHLDGAMQLANQSQMPVATDHFLHPATGKVLPIAGNVGYDPIHSKLIPLVDDVSGESNIFHISCNQNIAWSYVVVGWLHTDVQSRGLPCTQSWADWAHQNSETLEVQAIFTLLLITFAQIVAHHAL